jgi:hypothetical protein
MAGFAFSRIGKAMRAALETLIFQRMQPFLHRFGIVLALLSYCQR